jgi:HEAT repeat protein
MSALNEAAADVRGLLAQLESPDQEARLAAIEALSRLGDEAALAALRERLSLVGREQQALIIAIGALRWRLSGSAYSSLDHY